MTAPFPDPAPRALRLDLALEAGLALPDGPIAVFHPRRGEDLGPVARPGTQIVTPHAPDAAYFTAVLAARGVTCLRAPQGRLALSFVCLPRSRPEARDLIAQALAATDGPVVIDGQKDDGAEAILRDLRARLPVSDAISKGHGKIAWTTGPADLPDWRAAPHAIAAAGLTFATLPGVFSADGPDPASVLLADALPAGLKGVAVDLGAGWGYLAARTLATCPGLAALHLVESDARALDAARAAITDPRAQFHWADATGDLPLSGRADVVVMNPPFHSGRAAQPQLGAAFIDAAARLLKPSGQLFMVANRHLPYERALAPRFRSVTDMGGTPGFKLFLAQGPMAAAAAKPTRAAPRRVSHISGRRA